MKAILKLFLFKNIDVENKQNDYTFRITMWFSIIALTLAFTINTCNAQQVVQCRATAEIVADYSMVQVDSLNKFEILTGKSNSYIINKECIKIRGDNDSATMEVEVIVIIFSYQICVPSESGDEHPRKFRENSVMLAQYFGVVLARVQVPLNFEI